MDTTFPVDYEISNMTLSGFTLRNIYNSMVNNISGSINDTVIPASSADVFDSLAPNFDGSGWRVFDPSVNKYRPTRVKVGNIVLDGSPTANRLQKFQNQDGTIALLDDAYGIRDTVTLQEGLVSVDWDIASNFRVILSGDRQSVFYMQHSKPGMSISLLIINSGTKQTIASFDSLINWPAGSAPSMPASGAGSANSLLVSLVNVNGTIYGESQTQEQSITTSADKSTAKASLKTQHD